MMVGVLDVQGDVAEHVSAAAKACSTMGLNAHVEAVKTPEKIRASSALIIPGGESTTLGRLMGAYGLDEAVMDVAEDIPVFGTCAGMVVLAKEGDRLKEGQRLLGLMDAKIIRNAYGRQRDSFEADLNIPSIGGGRFPGVFIRAPAMEKVWGRCRSLCEYRGRIVLARQGNLLASAFHPELTGDTRLHEYFLGLI